MRQDSKRKPVKLSNTRFAVHIQSRIHDSRFDILNMCMYMYISYYPESQL
jgi:hypothetical protein